MGVVDLKLVSGGQTGVDRAALEAAVAAGVAHGGWCPLGRRAEDGVIDGRFALVETPSADYAQRTSWNVRDSDGTLILCRGTPTGGTELTIRLAQRYGRPCLVVDLDASPAAAEVRQWLQTQHIHTLNVAGPRESTSPGITATAREFVAQVLEEGSGVGGQGSGRRRSKATTKKA